MSASSQCGAGGRVARRCWISWRAVSTATIVLQVLSGSSCWSVLSSSPPRALPAGIMPKPRAAPFARQGALFSPAHVDTAVRHRRLRRDDHCMGLRQRVARARPTPPSSTAAPSHTPRRRCLRGVPTKLAHVWLTRYCRSAQRSADRSVQPRKRTRRGCTAPTLRWAARRCSGPRRLGNARTDAAPSLAAPEGRKKKAPAPLRSARATGFLPPLLPVRGLRQSLRSWR